MLIQVKLTLAVLLIGDSGGCGGGGASSRKVCGIRVVIVVEKGGDDSGDSEHGSISDARRLVDCSGCLLVALVLHVVMMAVGQLVVVVVDLPVLLLVLLVDWHRI